MLDAHPAPDAPARPPLPALATDRPAGPARNSGADALFAAARTLLPVLEDGRPLDAATLRGAMTDAFGASDAGGGWVWKDAYEASAPLFRPVTTDVKGERRFIATIARTGSTGSGSSARSQ